MKGKGAQEDGTGGLPKGATGREGTVTEEKVREWATSPFWASENVALRSDGSWIGIDVDAYGEKHGEETLALLEAELGELPATITSTSREPYLEDGSENQSRIRFYLVPAGLQFISRLTDIDIIQRSHRYAICAPSRHPSGREYVWYGYDGEPLMELPSVGDFEELPEAWLNRLILPDVDRVSGEGFAGSLGEWAERCTPGEPSAVMQEWVRCIPQADFGHDVMIQMQGAFVNLGVQGEAGVPWALDRLRSEWLRAPYDTEQYRTDFDVSLRGAIEKFGAFPPGPHDIPSVDTSALLQRIHQPGFADRLVSLPHAVTAASLRERTAWIASSALDSGLSPVEAAALAWASAAAQAEGGIREQGLHAVWALVGEVAMSPVREERVFIEPVHMAPPPPEPKDPSDPSRRVRLTNDEEDATIDQLRWWGDEFMEVYHKLMPVMTDSYYRLHMWMTLSMVFADKAYIQWEDGARTILNFYGGILGDSGSGKSRSKRPMREIPRRFYGEGEDPDIGGDATSSALTRALILRDGKTSLFHADEAHGLLGKWKESMGPFTDMKSRVTDMYMGEVPALQRTTDKDISGINAKTYLNVHLTGVFEKVIEVIEPEDWETGFINRFVWARGHRKELTRDQKRNRIRRPGSSVGGQKDWHAQWVAQFTAISNTVLGSQSGKARQLDVTDEVLDREVELKEHLERMAAESPYAAQLGATFVRLSETILKCAALVAITEKRVVVEMSDYLIALRQGEEWIENVLDLVAATNKPKIAREVDRLESMIEQNGGVMELAAIHRRHEGRSRYVTDLIRELIAQGRAEQFDRNPAMNIPAAFIRLVRLEPIRTTAPQSQPSMIPEGGIHI